MLLALNEIEKSFADELILKDVSLTINENDRIGLVGANGAGKTTLLDIICKNSESDKGEVAYSSGLTVGYLKQGGGLVSEKTIMEECLGVFSELLDALSRMRELEAQIALCDGERLECLTDEYARLSAFFEQRDGYNIEVKIRTVLNGMGFPDKLTGRRTNSLSGGEKTRLALAKLLLSQPRLLILDEPTNHLDFKTLMWLEDYLDAYKGALLLVSHDRYFLDKLVKTVWELSESEVSVFKGNYSKYKSLKEEKDSRRQKEYEQTKLRRDKMLDFAQKNIARASTSNIAKGRLKQLANMEEPKKPRPEAKPPVFSFALDREPVKQVLEVENFDLTVGDRRRMLIKDLSFTVRRGEKVAVIGDNGTGKSTLLKALVSAGRPGERDNKEIRWGANASLSYYDQENKNLDFNNTLVEELHRRFPTQPQAAMRALLGRVRITEDDAFKKVSVVSGGERAKLGLAIVMALKANTVLLDEPTNHLDLISKEALEKALVEFDGTLIFVSHDRYFLNSVPTRIIELTTDGAFFYEGGFDEYMAQKAKSSVKLETENKPAADKSDNAYYKTKLQRSEEAKRRSRLSALEKELAQNEGETALLEAVIADPENAADYGKLNEACEELTRARGEYDLLLEEWLLLTDDSL